ncbi:MAG: Crp/Fnr family transcriptional regulator [Myxococcota bacterium]
MAGLSPTQKRDLLRSVPLFQGLAPDELDGLIPVARTVVLKKREELFHKGDAGAQVYVIIAGKLKALTTSDAGDDVVFSILGPGEVLGEIALLGGTPRTATVTAIEPSELLIIDRRDFLSFLRSHPEVSIKLLDVLARRMKQVSEFVEDTLFLNLPLRLAKKLVALAQSYGVPHDGGVRLDLNLSQEEWGDLVGTTRESINKQLRAWTDDAIISTDRGYIVIHKMGELEKLAGAVVY